MLCLSCCDPFDDYDDGGDGAFAHSFCRSADDVSYCGACCVDCEIANRRKATKKKMMMTTSCCCCCYYNYDCCWNCDCGNVSDAWHSCRGNNGVSGDVVVVVVVVVVRRTRFRHGSSSASAAAMDYWCRCQGVASFSYCAARERKTPRCDFGAHSHWRDNS